MDERAAGAVRAHCRIEMAASTIDLVSTNQMKKGDVLGTASFAGRRAAAGDDPTAALDIVEMAFTINPTSVDVSAQSTVGITADPRARDRVLAAAGVAALTIYDMCKSADRTMVISTLSLEATPG